MSTINRRAMLQAIGASVTAPFAGDVPTHHWLDAWSSQDIEAMLRELGVWPQVTRERNRRNRLRSKLRRQERRAENIVVWRGRLAESLPQLLWRAVVSNRRDVRIATAVEPFVLHGYEIPIGARVLVDSRVRDTLIGARGEIIDTPTGRRLHIWPTPDIVGSTATLGNVWPGDVWPADGQ